MTTFGYFLSSEEHDPKELVRQAKLAEEAGFEALWISDHFHPWLDEQGESSFVWSVIGAISQATSLPVTTAVTCPLIRIHPAIIAQAAATAQILLDGRFRLGVGTGEALNEHILGDQWPPAEERQRMLEEAVDVIRELWTGELVTHHGEFYEVDTARLYSLPDRPPPIYISGFGPKSVDLAGRLGDGYIHTAPAADMVEAFHKAGGEGKPCAAGLKVCWAHEEADARRTVHRLWPNQGIPGEAAQLLPLPRHFEQLSQLVTEEAATQSTPCGPSPDAHLNAIRAYVDAGFDEVYISQIGEEQEGFFEFYSTQILPRLRERR
ncbi:TIGR03557 family F420-dependent LLM class oxidoreductase [Microbispora bryophytorum]|uniref:LLM class F420-dependent oxidoreductase n=1 Tax=Microbispora bryophytorum TaxID=1460882 RepID=A0A8H9LC27_9ACTN|nr:TIGR03557 family F420-dependent LLM class oxidoreductase [Microbispora bryophytorum]MBD3137931.1 TIGR03557 family F420-dependent LLM class oxidoreductase [Microbispora bryophytorum]TQS05156.1 TIGR03557 family F420-dependent LLM class oxidoreductase [Microbispora bryophytorum]GGO22694.1 LLM class F420-dependent oxidoreductase [Microbispora bryophytorum]